MTNLPGGSFFGKAYMVLKKNSPTRRLVMVGAGLVLDALDALLWPSAPAAIKMSMASRASFLVYKSSSVSPLLKASADGRACGLIRAQASSVETTRVFRMLSWMATLQAYAALAVTVWIALVNRVGRTHPGARLRTASPERRRVS